MTVSRPSGKMISVSPALTALISVRVAIGRAGLSGMARVTRRNGFTHQRFAIPSSMAKTGSCGSSESASAASRKLTWLSATMAFGPALAKFSEPRTSSR